MSKKSSDPICKYLVTPGEQRVSGTDTKDFRTYLTRPEHATNIKNSCVKSTSK
jgi:hypothetical protein